MSFSSSRKGHNPWFFRSARSVSLLILLAMGLVIAAPFPAAALEVPKTRGYVTDIAGMLSPASVQKIEGALQSFDQSDSTQVAVLTITSLEGDSLDDFSIRVAEAWGIGQKGKDNGVLLLIAKDDRKIKIEVGRGLEGVLTDLLSGRIIDQIITPQFKAGQFEQGIESGIAAIIQATRGEFTGTGQTSGNRGKKRSSPIFAYLIFGFFIINALGRVSRPLGGIAGALILPIIVFAGLSLPFSLLLILLLLPLGGLSGFFLPVLLASSAMGHHRGGFYGGFGGSSGGFSSSGGGFGGGGFGGGGASGGW